MGGRTRRYTIGSHGIWTPETARKQATILLAGVSQGEYPAEIGKRERPPSVACLIEPRTKMETKMDRKRTPYLLPEP